MGEGVAADTVERDEKDALSGYRIIRHWSHSLISAADERDDGQRSERAMHRRHAGMQSGETGGMRARKGRTSVCARLSRRGTIACGAVVSL